MMSDIIVGGLAMRLPMALPTTLAIAAQALRIEIISVYAYWPAPRGAEAHSKNRPYLIPACDSIGEYWSHDSYEGQKSADGRPHLGVSRLHTRRGDGRNRRRGISERVNGHLVAADEAPFQLTLSAI